MGDPKKLKKKYSTPAHPWNKNNIEQGRILTKEYGLKSRKEILIAESFLKKYKNIAKKLVANSTDQGAKEKEQVLKKLQEYGLLPATAGDLDQVLGLEIKDVLERRVQSLVFRKSLARTMNQARQFIVHRHIKVGDKEITSPSVLLSLKEEAGLSFKDKSNLADEEHPERKQKEISKEEITVVEKAAKKEAPAEDVKEEPKVEVKKDASKEEVKKELKSEEEPKVEEKEEVAEAPSEEATA